MSTERWAEVDRYYTDLLLPDDEALSAALRASDEAGLPRQNVSPLQGKMLMLLAQIQRSRSILEIGTLGGYSTIWLARSMAGHGRLVSLEANPKHAEVARINIARAGLADLVDLRVGQALETLPKLASEGLGPFDLIFIDADKANNTAYFEWSLRLSRRGTLIIADNVVRDGAVIDAASNDPGVLGIRRFNERLSAEPRVSATAIQTVGIKGYDGFAIALVTADG